MGRLLALPLPIALLENLPFTLAAEELTFAYARVRPEADGHQSPLSGDRPGEACRLPHAMRPVAAPSCSYAYSLGAAIER